MELVTGFFVPRYPSKKGVCEAFFPDLQFAADPFRFDDLHGRADFDFIADESVAILAEVAIVLFAIDTAGSEEHAAFELTLHGEVLEFEGVLQDPFLRHEHIAEETAR